MRAFAVVATAALALLPLAQAEDFRILVKFSEKKYHTGTNFCKTWVKDCESYKAGTGLYYAGSVCEPGDYSGKNKNSQALASCVFEKSVGEDVAKELHLTV